jgi:hypothetical protein
MPSIKMDLNRSPNKEWGEEECIKDFGEKARRKEATR